MVVTLNYRLGPLGFLAHPALSAEAANHVSGNYALLDAIAALRWVRANIAVFGGDPDNVTLYSESAGAGLSSVLLASPPAAGLFQRLVVESLASLPSTADNTTLAQAEQAGTAYATALGATDAASLRALTPQQAMAGAGAVVGPVVDGLVFPDQLDRLLAQGKVQNVPLLLGWNADEGTPYPPFGDDARGLHRCHRPLRQPGTAVPGGLSGRERCRRAPDGLRSDADSLFAWQPWTLARAHAALQRSKTFLYFFSRRPAYYPDQKFIEQDPPSKYGAYHSLEQVYFYDNLARSAPPRPYDDTDRRIADTASSYLVNFARSGDPNGGSLPAWPAFTGAGSQAMGIGDAIAPVDVPFQPALAFYDAFYSRSLGRALPF